MKINRFVKQKLINVYVKIVIKMQAISLAENDKFICLYEQINNSKNFNIYEIIMLKRQPLTP